MRNNINLSKNLFISVEKLPYFEFSNLRGFGASVSYLRILLARRAKRGDLIRLKKGLYTTKKFIDKTKINGRYSPFLEFLAGQICHPSYLSLDYVLYRNNLITEIPVNFTLITSGKTASFFNQLGNFIYHKIKGDLFCGFEIVKDGEFVIYKATKAKALFDFLYLRKNLLISREIFNELRLNLDELSLKDKKEFKKYVNIDGSKTMLRIYSYL